MSDKLRTGLGSFITASLQNKFNKDLQDDVKTARQMSLQDEALEGEQMPIVKEAWDGVQVIKQATSLNNRVRDALANGLNKVDPERFQLELSKMIDDDDFGKQNPGVADYYINTYSKEIFREHADMYREYRKQQDTQEGIAVTSAAVQAGNKDVVQSLKKNGLPGMTTSESDKVIAAGVKQGKQAYNTTVLGSYQSKEQMFKDIAGGITPETRETAFRDTLYSANRSESIVEGSKATKEYEVFYTASNVLKNPIAYDDKVSKKALNTLAPYLPKDALYNTEVRTKQMSDLSKRKLLATARSLRTYTVGQQVSQMDQENMDYLFKMNEQNPKILESAFSKDEIEDLVKLKTIHDSVRGGMGLQTAIMDYNEKEKLASANLASGIKPDTITKDDWRSSAFLEDIAEDQLPGFVVFEPKFSSGAETYSLRRMNYWLQKGKSPEDAKDLTSLELRRTSFVDPNTNTIVMTNGKSYNQITGLDQEKVDFDKLVSLRAGGSDDTAKRLTIALEKETIGKPRLMPGNDNVVLIPTNKTETGIDIDFIPIIIGKQDITLGNGKVLPSISNIYKTAQRLTSLGDSKSSSEDSRAFLIRSTYSAGELSYHKRYRGVFSPPEEPTSTPEWNYDLTIKQYQILKDTLGY